jgi:hypothetical protein
MGPFFLRGISSSSGFDTPLRHRDLPSITSAPDSSSQQDHVFEEEQAETSTPLFLFPFVSS